MCGPSLPYNHSPVMAQENIDEREDLGIIKRLGLKFRGENAWPKFRSYRPGFAPWFLEKSETTTLNAALSASFRNSIPREKACSNSSRAADPVHPKRSISARGPNP